MDWIGLHINLKRLEEAAPPSAVRPILASELIHHFGCSSVTVSWVYAASVLRSVSHVLCCSGRFRGGEPAPPPPPSPLCDGLAPSLTVLLANAKFWSFYYKTW